MSGPLPHALLPIAIPVSWLYAAGIAIRNRKFDRGRGVVTIERPVISVGNLTTGGTGKSPIVGWLAEQLLNSGHKPAIAMRGYKSRASQLSDEQAEYAQRIPDVHVLANPGRISALREFLPLHQDVSCVILDDGFQHRQIKRNLDLVLVDATAGTFEERMLPAGHLREPAKNLRRADAVIVTHTESEISNVRFEIERRHGNPPIAWCRHTWTHLTVFDHGSRPNQVDVDWLRGKRIAAMLGVGNPKAILGQIENAGGILHANIPAADHQRYDADKLNAAIRQCHGCDALVVTGKDWVKIEKVIDWTKFSLPIVVPRLSIEFVVGEADLLDLVLQRVGAPIAGKASR